MTTILLDADIVAYKVSAINQEDFDWDDTGHSRVVDPVKARHDTDELIGDYCDKLKADKVIVCLSDPKSNFRKELCPTYKSNRKDVQRPELLAWVKEYLEHEYRSFIRPRLEADDVMGILMTSDRFVNGEKIMVSEDKDMRTVPGLLYNPNKPDLGVIEVSELDANRFHMWQTICGDPVDGFPGCPGVGEKSEYAQEIIGACQSELWDIVLWAYSSRAYTEDDALLQARLAHILWASSYNLKTKKVRLWQPYWLL